MKRIVIAACLAALAVSAVSEAAGSGPVTAVKRIVDRKARKDARTALRQAGEADARADKAIDTAKGLSNRVGVAEQNASTAAARTYNLNVGDWPNGQLSTFTVEKTIIAGSNDWIHADCPDGLAVVSGGVAVIGPGQLVAQLHEGNSWAGAVDNPHAHATKLIVDVYCAKGLVADLPSSDFPRTRAALAEAVAAH